MKEWRDDLKEGRKHRGNNQRKCKHSVRDADKGQKTLHLPVLLSFSLWTLLWIPRTAVGYQATRIPSKLCQREREREREREL